MLKKWLKDNDIEMYSTHNEEKFVVTERLIRTLTQSWRGELKNDHILGGGGGGVGLHSPPLGKIE